MVNNYQIQFKHTNFIHFEEFYVASKLNSRKYAFSKKGTSETATINNIRISSILVAIEGEASLRLDETISLPKTIFMSPREKHAIKKKSGAPSNGSRSMEV